MQKCVLFTRQALFSLLVALLMGLGATAQNIGQYVRYSKGGTPSKLETSVVTMVGPAGQTLDLVSALHIGDAAYFKALNTKFKSYDAVLYELILPEQVAGQQLPAQMETGSGLSGIQGMMARSMGLVTQLDSVDYSPRNFVHADLTQEALSQTMASRQESLMTYIQKLLAASSDPKASQNIGVSDEEFAQLDLMAVISGAGTAKDQKILKKIMASTMTGSDSVLSAMNDTAIITERNKAALKALDAQVGKGKRKMALYYGAAHMPDLEASLKKKKLPLLKKKT